MEGERKKENWRVFAFDVQALHVEPRSETRSFLQLHILFIYLTSRLVWLGYIRCLSECCLPIKIPYYELSSCARKCSSNSWPTSLSQRSYKDKSVPAQNPIHRVAKTWRKSSSFVDTPWQDSTGIYSHLYSKNDCSFSLRFCLFCWPLTTAADLKHTLKQDCGSGSGPTELRIRSRTDGAGRFRRSRSSDWN